MVVVEAVVGGRTSEVSEVPASPSALVAAASAASAEPTPRRPAATPDPTRARSLVVRGWVARSAGLVQVMVASHDRTPISLGDIDPTGKPRNGMVPFETTFALPRDAVETAGSLYVVATDGLGRPLADGTWQPVEGAIVEIVIR